MKRKEVMELVNLALDIIEKGKGVNGFPFVSVSISNYSRILSISVSDNGFDVGEPYDGEYVFDLQNKISDRVLRTCKAHLKELLERAKGFEDVCITEDANAAELI